MIIPSSVKLYAVGDSITAGLGNDYTVDEQAIFPAIFNSNQREIVNRGLGHGRIVLNSNQSWSIVDNKIMNYDVNEYDRYIFLTGVNDMSDGTAHIDQYEESLKASLAWMGVPNKNKITARDSSVVYSGTWSNETTYYGGSLSKKTTEDGATATISVVGKTIFLVATSYDGGGDFDVTIDGVSQDRISLDDSWGRYPLVKVYTGLDDESHTIILTSVAPSSETCQFEWAGGIRENTRLPKIFLGNCVQLTSTGYASIGGSDADVATYNVKILSVANEIISDGLDIVHCDVSSDYNPDTAGQCQTDGIHPSTDGHTTIGNSFATYL